MKRLPAKRLITVLLALLLVGAWWWIERLTNSVPEAYEVEGSVALVGLSEPQLIGLADSSATPSEANGRAWLTVAAGIDDPPTQRIQVELIMCGGTEPFVGYLLFFGEAQLLDPVAVGTFGELEPVESVAGTVPGFQAFPVSLRANDFPCLPDPNNEGIVGGAPFVLGGEMLKAPVRRHTYWGLDSVRTSVALPAIGLIPGRDSRNKSAIDGDLLGLDGPLYPPLIATNRGRIEKSGRLRTEQYEPSSGASVESTVIRWSGFGSVRPTVRLADQDQEATLESWLLLATILLGLATSLIATGVWTSLGTSESEGSDNGDGKVRKEAAPALSFGVAVSLLALVAALVRLTRRDS